MTVTTSYTSAFYSQININFLRTYTTYAKGREQESTILVKLYDVWTTVSFAERWTRDTCICLYFKERTNALSISTSHDSSPFRLIYVLFDAYASHSIGIHPILSPDNPCRASSSDFVRVEPHWISIVEIVGAKGANHESFTLHMATQHGFHASVHAYMGNRGFLGNSFARASCIVALARCHGRVKISKSTGFAPGRATRGGAEAPRRRTRRTRTKQWRRHQDAPRRARVFTARAPSFLRRPCRGQNFRDDDDYGDLRQSDPMTIDIKRHRIGSRSFVCDRTYYRF